MRSDMYTRTDRIWASAHQLAFRGSMVTSLCTVASFLLLRRARSSLLHSHPQLLHCCTTTTNSTTTAASCSTTQCQHRIIAAIIHAHLIHRPLPREAPHLGPSHLTSCPHVVTLFEALPPTSFCWGHSLSLNDCSRRVASPPGLVCSAARRRPGLLLTTPSGLPSSPTENIKGTMPKMNGCRDVFGSVVVLTCLGATESTPWLRCRVEGAWWLWMRPA